MGHAVFSVGELTAVIGDNEAHGLHRAGYNGVWSLRHASSPRELFVPGYSGLNLEHIFDGEADDSPSVFFEPRRAPMTFRQISETKAELHQPPTPTFHLESWTRFTLAEPHFIDVSFRCMAHRRAFRRGYIGLFWASYIYAPQDKSIYFLGGPEEQTGLWSQLCTPRHNDGSTVRYRQDWFEPTFRDGYREALFRSFSPLRYDLPFYYGCFDDLVWIVMFDRAEGVRFSHSPSGGGTSVERQTANPAWDFQLLIPSYEVGKEYGFKLRTALRPRCLREEILATYRRWAQTGAS